MKSKRLLVMSLLIAAALLTGCSSASEDTAKNDSKSETQSEVSKEEEQETEAESKEELPKEDVDAEREKADIEALAAECVYNVYWYTEDDEYSAGTSFLMDSDVHGEKLLVSAFHYLWPEEADTFTGNELPDYVLGGEIYNAYTGDFTDATLKSCLIIEDADSIPAIDKDVSAFAIQDGENLKTLPLAETPAKEGEKVYLLAYLWDTEDMHDNCVYEGEVSTIEEGVMYYTIEGKPGTSGASGAPIVNEYGEVVAIHIGSNAMYYAAHTADSFLEQINNGTMSDITYPDYATMAEAYEEVEPSEYLNFSREEKVSSMFFDIQLDGVTVAESLPDAESVEGYVYMIVDVSLCAASDTTEPVPMYYYDFALEWDEEYCYPLEVGLTDAQLPDEYTITQEVTTGQLVFMAPESEESVIFSFMDSYYTDNPDDVTYGAYYGIELPLENWTR